MSYKVFDIVLGISAGNHVSHPHSHHYCHHRLGIREALGTPDPEMA